MIDGSAFSLEHLNDFAVLILFAVLESTVRELALDEIRRERGRWDDALVGQFFEDATATIRRESFARVLGLYKSRAGAGLVEEVNQVRRHRNWVAHGGSGGASRPIP